MAIGMLISAAGILGPHRASTSLWFYAPLFFGHRASASACGWALANVATQAVVPPSDRRRCRPGVTLTLRS